MFSVNEKVRCIDPNDGITMGKIYTVSEVDENGVYVIDDLQNIYYYFDDRFESVKNIAFWAKRESGIFNRYFSAGDYYGVFFINGRAFVENDYGDKAPFGYRSWDVDNITSINPNDKKNKVLEEIKELESKAKELRKSIKDM